ncbi:MAG: hypothetical protein R3B90_17710 [Planctomycetaceae bacterium]
MLLLRDPLTTPGGLYSANPVMERDATGLGLLPGDYDGTDADLSPAANSYGDFWNDFDSSAYHDGTRMHFNGSQTPDTHLRTDTAGTIADPSPFWFSLRYR